MCFVSHLYFDRIKLPSSGWMAVTSITRHYYYTITNNENLHALQRKINARALLPDATSPYSGCKKIIYIQAFRLNTVQPIGPLTFFIPESWFFPGHFRLTVYWHPKQLLNYTYLIKSWVSVVSLLFPVL